MRVGKSHLFYVVFTSFLGTLYYCAVECESCLLVRLGESRRLCVKRRYIPKWKMSKTSDTHNARLAVYWHPACEEHKIPSHPEQPGRVPSILHALQENFPTAFFREANRVTDEQILNVHHLPLLRSLQSKFALTNTAKSTKHETIYENIDGDTVIMFGSEEAIYRAAGAAIQAVDDLYLDSILSSSSPSSASLGEIHDQVERPSINLGFCCVRPPGHHAEPYRSMGFCFVNNVLIAAEHARLHYGVQRVAILDFDVHHGNGTNEYSRLLFHHYKKQQEQQQEKSSESTSPAKSVFMGGFGAFKLPSTPAERVYSSHDFLQFVEILENQRKYRAKCHNNINKNDNSNSNHNENNNEYNNLYPIFYASTHERQGYPGTGVEVPLEKRTDIDRFIVNRNIPHGPKSRTKFREKWCEIIQEMLVYNPQLVIFSAGFDAHDDDPLADVELQDEDFYWVTREVLDRLYEHNNSNNNNRNNQVKVMSVLEGGYDLDAIARCAVEHVQAMVDAFENSAYFTTFNKTNNNTQNTNNNNSNILEEGKEGEQVGEIIEKMPYSNADNEHHSVDNIETVLNGVASHGGDEVAALQEILSELGIQPPAKSN